MKIKLSLWDEKNIIFNYPTFIFLFDHCKSARPTSDQEIDLSLDFITIPL